MIANNTSEPNSTASVCGCCGSMGSIRIVIGKIYFDTVASAPLAMNSRKASRGYWCLRASAVYRNRGPLRPPWNPESQRKFLHLRRLDIELDHAVERVCALLRQRHLGTILCPSQSGWDVQVHPYSLRIAEVGVDAIVGCHLWQRAGATRPAMVRVPY